jgi:hypothetical protein
VVGDLDPVVGMKDLSSHLGYGRVGRRHGQRSLRERDVRWNYGWADVGDESAHGFLALVKTTAGADGALATGLPHHSMIRHAGALTDNQPEDLRRYSKPAALPRALPHGEADMSNQGEGPQSTADLTAFVSASPIPSERADGPLRKDRPRRGRPPPCRPPPPAAHPPFPPFQSRPPLEPRPDPSPARPPHHRRSRTC